MYATVSKNPDQSVELLLDQEAATIVVVSVIFAGRFNERIRTLAIYLEERLDIVSEIAGLVGSS